MMNEVSQSTPTRSFSPYRSGRLAPFRTVVYAFLLSLGLLFAVEPQTVFQAGPLMQLSLLELLIFALLAAWGIDTVAGAKAPRFPRALALPVAFFWGSQLLATVFASGEQLNAIKFLYRFTVGILVGWCAYDTLYGNPQRWKTLAKAIALGGAIVGIVGVLEATTGVGMAIASLFRRGVARVGDLNRVSATLVFPTVTALVLELTLPLLLPWLVEARRRWLKALLALLLLLGMTTAVLTLSRAGIALLGAIFVAIAAGGWWNDRERRAWSGADRPRFTPLLTAALSAAATLAVLTVLLLTFQPTARLRLTSETEATWYQATYQSEPIPALSPGSRVRVPVTVSNVSPRPWLPSGSEPFLLSYHLYEADGTLVTYDGARTVLDTAVAPGAKVTLDANLHVPAEPGNYLVAWDMLQEGVLWFSWKGSAPHTTTLLVAGEPVVGGSIRVTEMPAAMYRIPTPTRFELWRVALGMVRESPLLGIGPGTFRWRYGPFLGFDRFDPHIHTNNQFIEFLVGSGIAGLAGFLLFSVALAREAWRSLRNVPFAHWPWRFALLILIATWYIHGLVDVFWEFTSTYVLLWLLVALSVVPVSPAPGRGDAA